MFSIKNVFYTKVFFTKYTFPVAKVRGFTENSKILGEILIIFLTKKNYAMKKETWKLVVQILISVLTALGTSLGVTSCM